MRTMLLGFAASAAAITITAPAQAEHWSDPSFIAAASVAVHRGGSGFENKGLHEWSDGRHHGRRDGRRQRRDRDDDIFVYDSYGYQEDNPAWQPDGFNDWWHERTSRSFPRWTQNNQNCERQYWTGAGWRC